jgi:hypothetical protein
MWKRNSISNFILPQSPPFQGEGLVRAERGFGWGRKVNCGAYFPHPHPALPLEGEGVNLMAVLFGSGIRP